MNTEMRVYLADNNDFDSLRRWLADVPEVTLEPVARAPQAGEQGGAWDFLAVLCGTGGAMTVAVRALTTWIESKMTDVDVKIGDAEFKIRSGDPEAAGRMLEAVKRAATSDNS